MAIRVHRRFIPLAGVVVALGIAAAVHAGSSSFNDSYSGCSWSGFSNVYLNDADSRTQSNCANYTYRYTQVIDVYGATQIQNWSGYVAQSWNEYYYGHNDCGEMYGEHNVIVGYSGPSTRSTDAYR